MKWAEWNLLGEFEEKPNSSLACNSVKFGNFAESERLHIKGYWKKNNLKRLYWNIENYFEWSKISNDRDSTEIFLSLSTVLEVYQTFWIWMTSRTKRMEIYHLNPIRTVNYSSIKLNQQVSVFLLLLSTCCCWYL